MREVIHGGKEYPLSWARHLAWVLVWRTGATPEYAAFVMKRERSGLYNAKRTVMDEVETSAARSVEYRWFCDELDLDYGYEQRNA